MLHLSPGLNGAHFLVASRLIHQLTMRTDVLITGCFGGTAESSSLQ